MTEVEWAKELERLTKYLMKHFPRHELMVYYLSQKYPVFYSWN